MLLAACVDKVLERATCVGNTAGKNMLLVSTEVRGILVTVGMFGSGQHAPAILLQACQKQEDLRKHWECR